MLIVQTTGIALLSPPLTFGQLASLCRPVDLRLCLQQWAKAQHCHKTPRHKKEQSNLPVVKNNIHRSAGKATKECTQGCPAGALTSFWRLFGVISWSRLGATAPVRHTGSCSPVSLYNNFSLSTSLNFPLLWLFYPTLFFNGILLVIYRSRIMTAKRNS